MITSFFASQGKNVAPMRVEFGMDYSMINFTAIGARKSIQDQRK